MWLNEQPPLAGAIGRELTQGVGNVFGFRGVLNKGNHKSWMLLFGVIPCLIPCISPSSKNKPRFFRRFPGLDSFGFALPLLEGWGALLKPEGVTFRRDQWGKPRSHENPRGAQEVWICLDLFPLALGGNPHL